MMVNEDLGAKVSVVVCTWNRARFLEGCLESIIQQSYRNFQIVVVNAPSNDETRSVLSRFPVTVVEQGQPNGLAAARNLGIDASEGEIVAFIDDDAVAGRDWVRELVSGYSQGVGGVAGPVVRPDGKVTVAGPVYISKLGDILPESLAHASAPNSYLTFNGCNMSFRRDCLRRVGGFDPFFRFYFDEVDVCVRIQRAGFRLQFAARAKVQHLVAPAEYRARVGYYVARSRAYFVLKNSRREVRLASLAVSDLRRIRSDFTMAASQAGMSGGLIPHRVIILKDLMVGRLDGYLHGMTAPCGGA